jgi:Ice-binding-like
MKTNAHERLAATALLLLSLMACGSTGTSKDGRGAADGPGSADASSAADGQGGSGGHGTMDAPVALSMDAFDAGAPTAAVALGGSGNFAILAMSAISTVPTSAVTGNLGISPGAASMITGFPLTADATNAFSITPQVTGKVYAADDATPTPATLTTAIGDMQTAFTAAAGRAPGVTELGAGNVGGMTLGPGVYKWGTSLLIPTDVALKGGATDVWIFEIGQDLTLSSGAKVVLSGGALPKNIFWQVAGLVELGTTSHCEGTILSQTAITLRTGASINGRLLAQTAVNLDSNAVVAP